jgi:3-methyladenine DNA glycosylase/8-oxoguanine DNA glycosylase
VPAPSPAALAVAAQLSGGDPRLAGVIELIGPPPTRRAIPVTRRFESLATAILHQQLAGKAAATITARSVAALGALAPEPILSSDEAALRACGVSGAKAAALRDLAAKVASGQLDLGALGRRSDDEVIEELVAVRGIGRWTAEMFLMGPLGRPDVWPVGDLGVRSGWALISGEPARPANELGGAADHLRPLRSSVAWYCWQAVDLARSNGGLLPREDGDR